MSYINAGRVGLLGAPTYRMLKDATLTSLLEVLRANRIPHEHNKSDNIVVLKETGSRILCRTLSDSDALRGTNLAWFGVDELTYAAEPSWLQLEGRLRDPKATHLCGYGVWTPKGRDWVHRRFIGNPAPGYRVILAKAFENRHLLAHVPDFYERLRKSYSERFFRQEALGEYLNASDGLVYSAFDRGLQVTPTALDARFPLLWTLDFNVDPMCSLVAQIRSEHVYVLDEIVLSRASTADACREFIARYENKAREVVICGDASGRNRRTTGSTDYEVISRCFDQQRGMQVRFRVPNSNPPIRDRVEMVNAKCRNADSEARLWVNPSCRELIKNLEQVAYKTDSSVIDKLSDPQRTHISDALGYLLWEEFGPKLRIGERQKPLF